MKANKDKGTSVGFTDSKEIFDVSLSAFIEKEKKPIDFKIEENLELINKQQWEDIFNEFSDDYLEFEADLYMLKHWLQKKYHAPEKK